MKPFILLLVVFILATLWTKVFNGYYDFSEAGKVAMCVMLILTAIGHFRFSKGMQMMIPAIIPGRKALVYATGIIEIVAGVGLLIPFHWSEKAGWFLIIFFVLLLPANIYAAIKHVDYERANFEGPGLTYLWFRVPLQLFFICWVYFFAIKSVGFGS